MRQGKDIIWSTQISFEDSVNGKIIQIPHFDGSIEINTSDWGFWILERIISYLVRVLSPVGIPGYLSMLCIPILN